MNGTRIVSGFGKSVCAQEYVLHDDQGRTLAVLSATQGKPALTFYNGKGEIRAWFTLTADERPDIRLFDESGSEVWRYNAHGVMARTPHPEIGVARRKRPKVATRRSKRNGGKPYAG